MHRKLIFVLFMLLFACAKHITIVTPVVPVTLVTPTLTLGQKIANLTGGLGSCASWQDHEDGEDLPDCQRMYDAIERGLATASKVFPQAATMQLSPLVVNFHRKARQYAASKPYPLIFGITSTGEDSSTLLRGYTVTGDVLTGHIGIDVYYSYEEILEHELGAHVVGYMFNGAANRDPAAIALGDGGYTDWMTWSRFPVYMIYCHGTSDDPFGIPGLTTSCALPYPLPPWSGYVAPVTSVPWSRQQQEFQFDGATPLPMIEITTKDLFDVLADYNVIQESNPTFCKQYHGMTDYITSTISICATQDLAFRRETAIHEALHIIYHRLGLYTGGPYEDQIEAIAHVWFLKIYGLPDEKGH